MIDFFGFDFVGILILLCILIYLLFDLLRVDNLNIVGATSCTGNNSINLNIPTCSLSK
jgi:hypothetical protein